MARFSRFRRGRRGFRRRRSRPCDLINLSVFSIPVFPWGTPGDAPIGTTGKPLIYATPLLDGGALDAILQEAASAAGTIDNYYNTQSVTKGLSFLGMTFQMVTAVDFDTQLGVGSGATGNNSITARHCIASLPTRPDSGGTPAVRAPITFPDLFDRNEVFSSGTGGRVLYRWEEHYPMWISGAASEYEFYYDTTGNSYTLDVTGSFFELSGVTNYGERHHRIKRRARLDENHALYLVSEYSYPMAEAQNGQLDQDVTPLEHSLFGVLKSSLLK